jgi:Uncharacterized protein conserved in bacteria (DUF2330)
MNPASTLRSRVVHFCFATILALFSALSAQPAEACGCGIYIPREGKASVNQEHVLIRWDGHTEDIILTLGVLGSSPEAALVIPVPAQATVKLADDELFQTLRDLTKPHITYQFLPFPFGYGGAAPPSSVTLLQRQTLGSFDVSTLAATDANALGDWLARNGYNLPSETVRVLTPYVAQHWYYVAVRLSPAAGTQELTGELQPLWITFAHDQIVYPMRASAVARESLTVFLYVLTEHRVEHTQSFGYAQVQYANWIDPAVLAPDSPLLPLVPRKFFLTKIVDVISEPHRINSDYVFEFAKTDDTYREEQTEYIYGVAGIPFCFLVPALLVIGIVAIPIFKSWRWRKRRSLP